jgi:hypothetical protein
MYHNDKKSEAKKGFWAKLMDGLDKHMEAQAQKGNCCCCSSQKPNDAGKDKEGCC